MNKKKLFSLIALLVMVLPVLVMGAEKKPVKPELKELTEKILDHVKKTHTYSEHAKVRDFVKKTLNKFPDNLEKMNGPCLICSEDMQKSTRIVLHPEDGGIPHVYHTACLYQLFNTRKPGVIDLDRPIDKNMAVPVTCPECRKICPCNANFLKEKYLEDLLKNPPLLGDRLKKNLADLPFELALKTIEEYGFLENREKYLYIGNKKEFDERIQRFFVAKKFGDYLKKNKKAANRYLAILARDIAAENMYLDFFIFARPCFTKEEYFFYFEKLFKNGNEKAKILKLEDFQTTIAFCLEEIGHKEYKKFFTTEKLINEGCYPSLLLALLCLADFPQDLQIKYLEKLLENAQQDPTEQHDASVVLYQTNPKLLDQLCEILKKNPDNQHITTIFKCFSPEIQINFFDTLYASLKTEQEKIDLLIKLKKQLVDKKPKRAVELVKSIKDKTPELLGTYCTELTLLGDVGINYFLEIAIQKIAASTFYTDAFVAKLCEKMPPEHTIAFLDGIVAYINCLKKPDLVKKAIISEIFRSLSGQSDETSDWACYFYTMALKGKNDVFCSEIFEQCIEEVTSCKETYLLARTLNNIKNYDNKISFIKEHDILEDEKIYKKIIESFGEEKEYAADKELLINLKDKSDRAKNPVVFNPSPTLRVLASGLFGGFMGALAEHTKHTNFFKKHCNSHLFLGALSGLFAIS